MSNNQFTITPFKNPGGNTVHRVYGILKGKVIRKNFKTEDEATTYKQNLEREAMNAAPLPAITTRLTSEQAVEAEHCFRLLDGKALTMTQAIKWALENYNPSKNVRSVEDAFIEFIADKKAANKREAFTRTLTQRLKLLVTNHGKTPVHQITEEQVKAIIHRKGVGHYNQESDYRAHTNFFNWCRVKEYISASPMDKFQKVEVDQEEPVVLPLEDCKVFMKEAEDFADGKLVPYMTLTLFCAIRPFEVVRLWEVEGWKCINLDDKIITLGPKITKGRSRRNVDIPDNAVAFLRKHYKKTPIVGANWRKDFDALKAFAGYSGRAEDEEGQEQEGENNRNLKPWVKDILRHTAISYHFALHEHEGKTGKWAGNSPDMIHKHYKGLVRKADVSAFWAIMPTK